MKERDPGQHCDYCGTVLPVGDGPMAEENYCSPACFAAMMARATDEGAAS